MPLSEALALFRLLGVHVEAMSPSNFTLAYFALAKRYHPTAIRSFMNLWPTSTRLGERS